MLSIDMKTVRVAKSCSKIPKRKQAEEEEREGYEQIFDKESLQLWNELAVQSGDSLDAIFRSQEAGKINPNLPKDLATPAENDRCCGKSTFFTLIVTKNVHNVLMKVATGSKI